MANKRTVILIAALLPASFVMAQAPAPAAAPAPAPAIAPAPAAPADLRVESVVIGKDEFTRMQREILLLKKRLEETELRAQITTKIKEIERLNAPQAVPEANVIFKSMRQSVDGDRLATFVLDNGSSMLVREGDTLPNGMRVASIRSDGVVLRKGSVERRLGVGGSTARPGGSATSPSTGGMPMGRPF